MRFKPWILGSFVIIGLGLDGFLLVHERVAQTERQVRHTLEKTDRLIDIRYTVAERETNLKSFGLQGDALRTALKRLKDLDTEQNRARFGSFLEQIGDPDRAADAFCGLSKVRPRYAVMAYVVKDERGQRDAIDLGRISRLEREAWALTAPIAAVYAEVEMGEERQPDATVMGVAALLLRLENEVLERNDPWGMGLGGRWNWDKVKKQNPGIEARVVEYLAVLHLAMEVATKDGGFCGV